MSIPSVNAVAIMAFAPVALLLSPLLVAAMLVIFVYEEW
jgi:hypothetical protein